MSKDTTSSAFVNATKDQLEKWKKEHGGVFALELMNKKGEKFQCIVRKPGIVDLQRAYASNDKKPFTFGESLFNNCKLHVHPDVTTNDALLLRAYALMADTVDVAEGTIKEV